MILFRGKKKSCLKHPKEIVSDLDEEIISQLAVKDLKKAAYPVYLVASDPKFLLVSYPGINQIKGNSLKEIDFSNNQISKLEGLDNFIKLKRLYASNNIISSVSLNTHVNLIVLDLSKNKLKKMPDLNALISLQELYARRNSMEIFDHKNIEKCTKLVKIDVSTNLLDYTHEELENLFTFLNSLKRLEDVNYSDNIFSSNLVDFRGSFVSRLSHLKNLNGIPVSKSEKKLDKEVEIIFAGDLKKKLDNTSAALDRVPSFHHIRGNSTSTFGDFISVMKETPENHILEVCEKLLDTFTSYSKEQKTIQLEGFDSFVERLSGIFKSFSNKEKTHQKIFSKIALVCFTFIPKNEEAIKLSKSLAELVFQKFDVEAVACIPEIFNEKSEVNFEILAHALKNTNLDAKILKQAYGHISKILTDHFNPDVSIQFLGLLSDALEGSQNISQSVFQRVDFIKTIQAIISNEFWSLTSEEVHFVLRLISATSTVLSSDFVDSGLFDEILQKSMNDFRDVNHDDAIGYSLLHATVGNLLKSEKALENATKADYISFLMKSTSTLLSKDELSKEETIICKGFVETIHIIMKNNSSMTSDISKQFVSSISFKEIFQKKLIIDSVPLLEIFEYSLQNKLIEYEIDDYLVDLIPQNPKILSILVMFDELSKKSIPHLINILSTEGIFKSDFSKKSKKYFAIELLMKIDLSDQEKLTTKVLELLAISSEYPKRFMKFSQLCVEFLKKGCIIDSEDNLELCKKILLNEESSIDSTTPLLFETALKLEIIAKLLNFLHMGTPVFNRVYSYFTSLCKDDKSLKKLNDTFVYETINQVLGKEFIIKKKQSMLMTPRGIPRNSNVFSQNYKDLPHPYFEELVSNMKDTSNPDVNRILSDEVPLKYLRAIDDFDENLSEISDISDIEDETTPTDIQTVTNPTPNSTPLKQVKRVHRQSVKFMRDGKHGKNEDSIETKEALVGEVSNTKTMWSYHETDHEDTSLEQFLNIYLGKDEKDTIYDLLVEDHIYMSKSDQNMLQSEYTILKLLYTLKENIYNLSVPNVLEFILRVCANEKLCFQFIYLIVCVLEMILKTLDSLISLERAEFLKDICQILSSIDSVILKRLKIDDNSSTPPKFNHSEVNFVIHYNNLWKLLIDEFLSFVFVDDEDYFGLVGESSSKPLKYHHMISLNRFALTKFILELLPLQNFAVFVTVLYTISKGFTNEKDDFSNWQKLPIVCDGKIETEIVDENQLKNSICQNISKYMDMVDPDTLYKLFDYLIRIDILGSYSLSSEFFYKILGMVKESHDNRHLQRFFNTEYNTDHLRVKIQVKDEMRTLVVMNDSILIFEVDSDLLEISNLIRIPFQNIIQVQNSVEILYMDVTTSSENVKKEIELKFNISDEFKLKQVKKILKENDVNISEN
eukprot:gene5758-9579_t